MVYSIVYVKQKYYMLDVFLNNRHVKLILEIYLPEIGHFVSEWWEISREGPFKKPWEKAWNHRRIFLASFALPWLLKTL